MAKGAMVVKNSAEGYVEALEGIQRKSLTYGEKTLMVKFLLKKGSQIPLHQHLHEQTGYLIEGSLHFMIAGVYHDMEAGDSWCVPGGVEHGLTVMEDSVMIEVFSPVREDYLPK